ncbi:MAG: DNA polymerase/3'-5' exonuclease PolX [Candidatus Marsarchaeota archaeon]|nr:DNA polymerase/3'-5' exonuclease PolX [Candidatus Marsarchaeota archaeon]
MFYEIADMLEIEDEKRIFEIRAYRKAALSLETMQEDVEEVFRKNGIEGLREIPGVGEGLAKKIIEYIETGRMKKYEEYKKKYPIDFAGLTQIQTLGARKAFRLYKSLGIRNVDDLKKAIADHRIMELEGFGQKSEAELRKGLELIESGGGRMLLGTALPEAEAIIGKLKGSGLASRVELAGSCRRRRETVGDIDILVTSEVPGKVMDFVAGLGEVESVTLKGPTKTTVRLKIGLSCDIRVLERKSFGAGMQYFIGSKDHNVKVRQIAIKKGYKLNEYGLFDMEDRIIAAEDEETIYEKLGMQMPEPEMRENRGEIELALEHRLPRLVQLSDIRGDLHVHTLHSDGNNTLEEMVGEAGRRGLEYVGITDHSKSEYVARGMDEARFQKYSKEIDDFNEKSGSKVKVLKSAETDILKDGSLDFSNKALDEMDYVLASIHTSLNMSKDEMTKRVIKCMESGRMNIFAHPTDRLINERAPIQLDLDKVFEAARENNVVMEIDSFPSRLDLNDENIFRARKYGLKFSVDTDSHRTSHMDLMKYGVWTAKRGWLTREDVINTMPLGKLRRFFKG